MTVHDTPEITSSIFSDMCIPTHVSLVICVSLVGIHKTLRAKYPGPQRQLNGNSKENGGWHGEENVDWFWKGMETVLTFTTLNPTMTVRERFQGQTDKNLWHY